MYSDLMYLKTLNLTLIIDPKDLLQINSNPKRRSSNAARVQSQESVPRHSDCHPPCCIDMIADTRYRHSPQIADLSKSFVIPAFKTEVASFRVDDPRDRRTPSNESRALHEDRLVDKNYASVLFQRLNLLFGFDLDNLYANCDISSIDKGQRDRK